MASEDRSWTTSDANSASLDSSDSSARVHELRSARDSYVVTWMKFKIALQKYGDYAHCFVEGKDEKFYSGKVPVLLATENVWFHQCGNKEAVLKILQLARAEDLKQLKLLFFVDRDFGIADDGIDISDERLYVTETYSIENFYVGTETIRRVLRSEFNLGSPSTLDELERVTDLVSAKIQEFANHMVAWCAWVAARREVELAARAGAGAGVSNRRLHLSGKRARNFFKFSLTGSEQVQVDCTPSALFGCEDPDPERVEYWRNLLAEDPLRFVRGKWLLDGLRDLLVLLQEDGRKSENQAVFFKKHNVPLQLSIDNLLSELAQYTITPTELRKFLSKEP